MRTLSLAPGTRLLGFSFIHFSLQWEFEQFSRSCRLSSAHWEEWLSESFHSAVHVLPEIQPARSEHPSSSPSPVRFHSGFPGSAPGNPGYLDFHQNVLFCKHLDWSCLMYRLKNKRPPSSTQSSYSNTGSPLEDITNHTVGRITAGGGELMEINQRSAHFTPSALLSLHFNHWKTSPLVRICPYFSQIFLIA